MVKARRIFSDESPGVASGALRGHVTGAKTSERPEPKLLARVFRIFSTIDPCSRCSNRSRCSNGPLLTLVNFKARTHLTRHSAERGVWMMFAQVAGFWPL